MYKYIGMLRYHHCEQEGLPLWIYEELRSIQEVAHKYSDEESPEDLVETIAEEMAPEWCLPPERLLDGSDLLFEYRPELIQVCTGVVYVCMNEVFIFCRRHKTSILGRVVS